MNLGRARAGGEQRNVPARKIEMLEILDAQRLSAVAEVDLVPGRARRRNCGDFVERELPLGQDVQHFTTDVAGGADDRDPIAHFTHSEFWDPKRLGAAPLSQPQAESDRSSRQYITAGGAM